MHGPCQRLPGAVDDAAVAQADLEELHPPHAARGPGRTVAHCCPRPLAGRLCSEHHTGPTHPRPRPVGPSSNPNTPQARPRPLRPVPRCDPAHIPAPWVGTRPRPRLALASPPPSQPRLKPSRPASRPRPRHALSRTRPQTGHAPRPLGSSWPSPHPRRSARGPASGPQGEGPAGSPAAPGEWPAHLPRRRGRGPGWGGAGSGPARWEGSLAELRASLRGRSAGGGCACAGSTRRSWGSGWGPGSCLPAEPALSTWVRGWRGGGAGCA